MEDETDSSVEVVGVANEQSEDLKMSTTSDGNGASDEAGVLRALDARIQDQDDVERTINRQADEMLVEQANERDAKRLDKAEADKRSVSLQMSWPNSTHLFLGN